MKDFFDNELDNALFCEILKDNFSEYKICELINNGANLNAVDKNGNSIFINLLGNVSSGEKPLNLLLIKLLIDLGVDLNYEYEGTNCLYIACLTYKSELVELLLKFGANPNCVGSAQSESLLDWAEFEHWFIITDNYGQIAVDEMRRIIDLLKKYGAKHKNEM